MRILLLGEYSNVHATLALGFRKLGHEVTVASNGDFWKNYDRDIDLARNKTRWGGIRLIIKIITKLKAFMGYDIVQLINPMFLELKAERLFFVYKFLRKHNKCVVLGAFGMDYYWVESGTFHKPLRYSDFNIGNQNRTNKDAIKEQKDWLGTAKEKLNKMIASDCDAIVCGLYEYWIAYKDHYPQKIHFVPFPIIPDLSESAPYSSECSKSSPATPADNKTTFFIGINKERNEYKGTDIMLQAALDAQAKMPDCIDLQIVESVPFKQYRQLMLSADAILDQLYSYTPSMNSLEAMSHGIICIGGGEPENYEILGDTDLKPIINVLPTYQSVFDQVIFLAQNREIVERLKKESKKYIHLYHDYIKIASKYLTIYNEILHTNKSC